MKFHSISVENLNSLYGRHTIDFERDVRNAPLFLIIGQTGAGKSTILDGVSLALFGVTPRLEQQRGAADTDVGHIMSVGTSECSAELEFSVRNADGTRDRFRATWSCRRAHGDSEGTLQRPERSLSRLVGERWQLLVSDSRNKEFEGPFNQALRGLTVDDFRRTILLAQGDFSALLHASDQEKAAILERLTSTEVYQEIGSRAAKRRRDAERKYLSLKGELEQTEVLEPTAREALETNISEIEQRVREADGVLSTADRELETVRMWESGIAAIEDSKRRLAEAREAFSELEPELQKLDSDKQFRHLEDAFRGFDAAESNFSDATRSAKGAEEAVGELAESLSSATSRRDEAKKSLSAVESRWKELAPMLEKAAEIEARLRPANDELESAQTILKAASLERETAKTALKKAEKANEEAKRKLATMEKALEEAPQVDVERVVARLDVHFGSTMRAAWERLESFEDSPSNDEANLRALRARRTRTSNLLEEVAPGLAGAGGLDEFAATLGADIARLREQRDALTEATYAMETLQQRENEKSAASEKIEHLHREIGAKHKERDAAASLLAERKGRVNDLRDAHRLAEQVIALSELREALEDGEPCPLCGSPLHPYCMSDDLGDTDARTRRDDLKGRLEVAEESVVVAEEDLRRADSTLSGKKTALQHQEGLRVEIVEKLERVKKTFAAAAEKGGFPPLEVWNLRQGNRLDEALAATANQLFEKEKTVELLRQRRSDWERAEEDLRTAEQNQADAQTRARLIKEARENWAVRLGELREIVGALGVDVPDAMDWGAVERVNEEARDKLRSLRTLRDGVEQARIRFREAGSALETATNEMERKRVALADASDGVDRRAMAVKSLEGDLREILPEGTPDELRKRRSQEIDAANAALEKARGVAEKIKSEHDQRAGRLRELQKQLEEASGALEQAQSRWDELAEEHSVDRDTVRAALLGPAERARLEKRAEAAKQARDRAQGALEAARKAHTSFVREHGEPVRSADEVERERTGFAAWRDAFAQEQGALRERKAQDDRRRATIADKQEELDRRRAEFQRWRTIAQLIGTGDGAAFRTFAQSLNLQGLVDRANVRLRHLAPRYELAVSRGEQGEPTLNFSVRDAFRAGHERPLTTLSGGETFLVSLSLALALSDYRRIELPVETLLLDEGFGTLDQDALHMAVDTLQRLHQDSTRQVGIISHVEALKEMIDARIVVEKKGNGRSHLRFEVSGLASNSSGDQGVTPAGAV